MEDRKFFLLIDEFANLNQGSSIKLESGDALVCQYKERQIIVENGTRLGLDGQIVLMAKLNQQSLSANLSLELNADFRLTTDGYIARISDHNFYFMRHITLPEHPQELFRLLNKFAVQVTILDTEIKRHVVD
ncbi:hypothetical protein L1D61_25440 [Vibrio mediterranei]|uniref:Uncharacterized protein n=1 Tax=Vibrio mediterranei TaxID=689 RepID=A0A3G4VJU3_9VIBR|nr:hypothetical protein [Vibrio mediterranei]AYV25084.1 hypothetical protein ECB94_27710 [Vibrio mediterranei]MCG9790499.1 hypothetical protein [Vibrio mediterranei]